jgi:hypothetical protein
MSCLCKFCVADYLESLELTDEERDAWLRESQSSGV